MGPPERVFVTGGHGFIGSRVVALLASQGRRVVAPFRNDGEVRRSMPGTHLRLDLGDTRAAADAMEDCDAVVHLAARAGGIDFQQRSHARVFADNQQLTASVLSAAARAGVRRVFQASSGVVYRPAEEPLPESAPVLTPADAPSGYAWSKICDEVLGAWYCASGELETVVGRFTNVYGPGGPATVVHDLIERAVAARDGLLEVWGDGSAVRSFIHVVDAARAVVTVLDRGEAGAAYNIDTGDGVAIADLAALIRDAVDPALDLRFDPSRPVGVPHRVLDPARLLGLGFTPTVPLTEGITRLVG